MPVDELHVLSHVGYWLHVIAAFYGFTVLYFIKGDK